MKKIMKIFIRRVSFKMLILIAYFGIVFQNYCYTEKYHNGSIDTVFYFKPGVGQASGQNPEFFPKNIFGLPSSKASKNVPVNSEDEICSLGIGGEIIVGFKNGYLYDDEGADFTIFENAFINPISNKVFAEPAIISVSENGIDYFDFPFDTLTLKGCAGISPTNGKEDPFNPTVSGGDSFDLRQTGLKRIKYIKIKDYCEELLKQKDNQYYDPIISGFDLDAVTARYLSDETTDINLEENNYKNMLTKSTVLTLISLNKFINNSLQNQVKEIKIYDLIGNLVYNFEFSTQKEIYLHSGSYFMEIIQKSGQADLSCFYINN